MNKQVYIAKREEINNQIKHLNGSLDKLKEDYIEASKPCSVGDYVRIELPSDRVITGIAKTIGIFKGDVVVTSYKKFEDGREVGSTRFISGGHGKLTILQTGV